MKMCAHGQLCCLNCMTTFLYCGLDPDTAMSPTIEELVMGCTHVIVPAPLGFHDDREQERADGHQERKRARVARFVFDKGSAGAISARSTLLMAMKRFVNGHAAGTETIDRPVPDCTFLARLPCHGHAAT